MVTFRLHIYIAILLILPVSFWGQELLSGLQINEMKDKNTEIELGKMKQTETVPLELPFFDDFNYESIYPNAELWLDKFVFINKDFPIFPPNTGSATFDALDEKGRVYTHATSVPGAFIADYLTSRPIRLDSLFNPELRSLGPADSIYLSFYYQPQGRGDMPESWDSLVLQLGYPTGEMVFDFVDSTTVLVDEYLIASGQDFLLPNDTIYPPLGCNPELYLVNFLTLTWGDYITLPCDTVFKPEIGWKNVWASAGMSYEKFVDSTGKHFQQVLIPIVDSIYFSDKFQFRFFNYATIIDQLYPQKRSNVDQWNIDYIYLNYDRNRNDTTYRALSFSERAPSFLRRYESMPYRQYRADPTNAIRMDFEVLITNLDGIERNTKYLYQVEQQNGQQFHIYDGGSCPLPPYGIFGFQNCISGCGAAHACPPVISLFSLDYDRDTTSYFITHYISDSTGGVILVDSLKYRQGFYNYFAYDDGTPELGYGLEPARGMLAYQFRMVTPDTLTGVQMYFNRTLNNANDRFFDIVIWDDNNGIPGDELYRLERQRPIWTDELYGFHLYEFEEPVILNGVFYVGWQQEQGGSLNIGWDVVNNSGQYIFYNIDGNWRSSDYEGSLMIRPVIGTPYLIGIDEPYFETYPQLMVFPNPTQSMLTVEIQGNSLWKPIDLTIIDITGRPVMNKTYSRILDISNLSPGVYMVRVTGTDGLQLMTKVIKSN